MGDLWGNFCPLQLQSGIAGCFGVVASSGFHRGISQGGSACITIRCSSRPMAAGRPFHCGFASIARSPLSFALVFQDNPMLYKKIILFILLAILTGCSEVDEKKLAHEEIKNRKLTYDLVGLKKSTSNLNSDGAFVFENAGFFDQISEADFKELIVHAIQKNNYGLVTILLKLDKNIHFEVKELNDYLDKAIESGFSRTVRLLINNGGELKSGSLFKAIYKDNYGFVKLILDEGLQFEPDEYKEALYVAARIGHLDAIRSIVESNKAPKIGRASCRERV